MPTSTSNPVAKPAHKAVQKAAHACFERLEERRLLSAAFVDDELLIQFQPGTSDATMGQVRALVSADVKKRISGDRKGPRGRGLTDLLSLSGGTSVLEAIDRLSSHPAVKYVEPNYLTSTTATPNDPSFSQLWGLHNTGKKGATADADIDAPEAWNITTGSSDVVVFVIDTGVDYNHPDLAANIWTNPFEIPGNGIDDEGNGFVDDIHGIDTANGDSNPIDDAGHGTHVAGTIGALGNNGIGVSGVNWNVKIGACKSHTASGSGTQAAVIECFNYVNDLKARGVNVVVTNNSWSGMSGPGMAAPFAGSILRQTMDGPAGMDKILHVVAASNDNIDNDSIVLRPVAWPASWNLDNILSVAATDSKDLMASFSNWGATTVDLAAPGVGIYSTLRNGSYGLSSGTSMATPHAAGAAALLAALRPGVPAELIKLALMDGTDFIGNLGSNASKPTVTNGRLNAHKALVDFGENDSTAPAPVLDLNVSTSGLWSIHLAWTATGDDGMTGTARSYDVRYSTVPITEDNWAFAASAVVEPRPRAPGLTETFRVQRLDYSTTYYFALKVRDSVGNESSLSNVVSASTAVATAAFADGFENGLEQWTAQSPWGVTSSLQRSGNFSVADSPAGDYANNTNASLTSIPIDLSNIVDSHLSFWSYGVSEFAVDYLRFEASADGGPTWTTLGSYTGLTGPGFPNQVVDLSAYDGNPSLRIRFRFESNGSTTGDGRYMDDLEVLGKALPPDTSAPSAPTNLAVTAATSSSISLAWNPSSDDRAVVAYDIYHSQESGDVLVGMSTTPGHTVGGLAPSTSYSFYVIARDAAGNLSPASEPVTASTSDMTVPIAPTNLVATKFSNRRVRLTWTDRSSDETGFHVWSSRDNITWTLMFTTSADATSYTTSSLVRGTWYFRVSGFNNDGESLFSNTSILDL